jgi:hypothetical protein
MGMARWTKCSWAAGLILMAIKHLLRQRRRYEDTAIRAGNRKRRVCCFGFSVALAIENVTALESRMNLKGVDGSIKEMEAGSLILVVGRYIAAKVATVGGIVGGITFRGSFVLLHGQNGQRPLVRQCAITVAILALSPDVPHSALIAQLQVAPNLELPLPLSSTQPDFIFESE